MSLPLGKLEKSTDLLKEALGCSPLHETGKKNKSSQSIRGGDSAFKHISPLRNLKIQATGKGLNATQRWNKFREPRENKSRSSRRKCLAGIPSL